LKEPTGRGAHAAITVGEPWERTSITLTVAHLQPIVWLIVGFLILIVPRLLNYIVAVFLIVSGVIGLGLIH